MPVFEYRGLTADGRDVAGIIDADNARTARTRLRKSGVFPTQVLEGRSTARPSPHGPRRLRAVERASLSDIALMTRQLATLLGARLPLMEALTALQEQVENPQIKKIVADVRERVKEGSSLAVTVAQYPQAFSEIYVNMVRAGEASGTLDAMLLRLADFLENQIRLRNKLIAALSYPVFMLGIAVVILFALVTFVMPKVLQIFKDMHQALPWPTLVLMRTSEFFHDFWWALVVLLVIAWIAFRRWVAKPEGRRRFDEITIHLPLVGRLALMVAISRFAKTLSTLLSSGVPLLEALDVVKNVVHNRVIEEAVQRARENIREGEGVSEPLRKSGVFPPLVTHMIAVGEKSGELEPMLVKVSEVYDNEVETAVNTLTSLLAPIMILGMGLVVLFIVLSILLPIFELSQNIR